MSVPKFATLSDQIFFKKGYNHIRRTDPKLGSLLVKHGAMSFKPQGEMFESIVESILSQQLAGAAAAAIIGRVRALHPERQLIPDQLHATSAAKLRRAGVSPQKLGYLRDLTSRITRGRLELEPLRYLPDDEIVRILDEVKGIGPWTVQMLLIFTLGRTDVLPVDDYGIRKGISLIYELEGLPRKAEIERLAENWHPYCSIASLYLWRHKDSSSERSTTAKKKKNNKR
jgi:3-methyladenine DNA glycosylase/8-oxoguanine DNA glycosylase